MNLNDLKDQAMALFTRIYHQITRHWLAIAGLSFIIILLILMFSVNITIEKPITLEPGRKFIGHSFRHSTLYITTRPMRPDEYAEDYTIKSVGIEDTIFHIQGVEP